MRSDFLALPNVRAHLTMIGRVFGEEWLESITGRLSGSPLESPIEAVFALYWFPMAPGEYSSLLPQQDVVAGTATYRLDFVVDVTDADLFFEADRCGVCIPPIAVELDGHEFHERTQEQVDYRNKRDRDLQAAGWVVLHFSGSEVMRDPRGCVLEVLRLAEMSYQNVWGQCNDVRARGLL